MDHEGEPDVSAIADVSLTAFLVRCDVVGQNADREPDWDREDGFAKDDVLTKGDAACTPRRINAIPPCL